MLPTPNIIRNRSYEFGRLPETIVGASRNVSGGERLNSGTLVDEFVGNQELSSQMVVCKHAKMRCIYLFVLLGLLGLCQLAILPNIHHIFDLITMPSVPSMPTIPTIPIIPSIPTMPSLPDIDPTSVITLSI